MLGDLERYAQFIADRAAHQAAPTDGHVARDAGCAPVRPTTAVLDLAELKAQLERRRLGDRPGLIRMGWPTNERR